MPAADLALLTRAALEAGEIALSFWKGAFRSWDKDGAAGPVTEADLAVNAHLERVLRGARSDYGWLSEESADDPARLAARHCFIVDPIDGTRAFIDGQDGFSIAIAVVRDGDSVAGVVHLPARGETYAARADGPALGNGQPIRPRERDIAGAEVLTNKPALEPAHWRGGRVPPLKRQVRSSLAWRLCLAAEGRFDAALSLRPAWEWDIAAGSLIAARAGCAVTDRCGAPMRFNTAGARVDGLVVAAPRLHRQIMDALDLPPVPGTSRPEAHPQEGAR